MGPGFRQASSQELEAMFNVADDDDSGDEPCDNPNPNARVADPKARMLRNTPRADDSILALERSSFKPLHESILLPKLLKQQKHKLFAIYMS